MGGDLNLLQTDWEGDAEKAILGDGKQFSLV
jgi:hypothetical protein